MGLYEGLRLIVERAGRYYAVPIGGRARTDNVFILMRAELAAGTDHLPSPVTTDRRIRRA